MSGAGAASGGMSGPISGGKIKKTPYHPDKKKLGKAVRGWIHKHKAAK